MSKETEPKERKSRQLPHRVVITPVHTSQEHQPRYRFQFIAGRFRRQETRDFVRHEDARWYGQKFCELWQENLEKDGRDTLPVTVTKEMFAEADVVSLPLAS